MPTSNEAKALWDELHDDMLNNRPPAIGTLSKVMDVLAAYGDMAQPPPVSQLSAKWRELADTCLAVVPHDEDDPTFRFRLSGYIPQLANALRAAADTCDRLEPLEKFHAWIRRKLEGSKLPCCEPSANVAGTDSEIYGWMHCVVADSQSWHRLLPQIDKERADLKAQVTDLNAQIAALTERVGKLEKGRRCKGSDNILRNEVTGLISCYECDWSIESTKYEYSTEHSVIRCAELEQLRQRIEKIKRECIASNGDIGCVSLFLKNGKWSIDRSDDWFDSLEEAIDALAADDAAQEPKP